jgi:RNA polymerase sigma factor (TIGR02999 family)
MEMPAPNSTQPAGGVSEMMNESVYRRLRRQAAAILRREACARPLEPDDLAHEAFLRIARSRTPIQFQDDCHFLALAAVVMRRILIDRARRADSSRHSRWILRDSDLPFSAQTDTASGPLRDALRCMERYDARLYQVVEMRFFWGLDINEVASALSISSRTVKRDWTEARGWLRRELFTDRRPPTIHTAPAATPRLTA